MKIAFFLDSPTPWNSGIWYHRNKTPSEALTDRGHAVRHYAIGNEITDVDLQWPDVVIFGRTYPTAFNPVEDMRKFKRAGKRVVYDIDDDFWAVAKDNPSVLVSNALKDQYEGLMLEADAITTPSKVLAKKIHKFSKKPVFICNNGINFDDYKPRPDANVSDLFIGYMGAASHWKDLGIVADVLEKLSEKHDFFFYLYGMTAEPFESAAYNVRKLYTSRLQPEKDAYLKSMIDFYDKLKKIKMIHTPFMPPEIHPGILSTRDFDIAIAPLEDTEFNRGKSCIKFYEYAATGTVTLASDVEPYASEVNYRAKNTFKDWYTKLERLIVDEEFRNKLQKEQSEWVAKNRSLKEIGLEWELALQLPSQKGAPKVLNQQK